VDNILSSCIHHESGSSQVKVKSESMGNSCFSSAQARQNQLEARLELSSDQLVAALVPNCYLCYDSRCELQIHVYYQSWAVRSQLVAESKEEVMLQSCSWQPWYIDKYTRVLMQFQTNPVDLMRWWLYCEGKCSCSPYVSTRDQSCITSPLSCYLLAAELSRH